MDGQLGSDGSCERLAASIQQKIISSPQYCGKYCCIYRVPPLLRQHNEQAYTPALVSIGPLHHNDKRLLPMESHKLSYLRSFLRHSPTNINLSHYLKILKDLETDIRRCYADPINLSSDDFIQMVLIDTVFIIELFRRDFDRSLVEDDDCMYTRTYMLNYVNRDMKLEENQLPFFVLVLFYRVAFGVDLNLDQVPSFTDLACKFLKVNKSKINVNVLTKEATPCCHLLDLLRSHYKPSDLSTECENRDDHHISIDIHSPVCPTVTSLFAAGVRFEVVSPDLNSSNLLDIVFHKEKGILKIPKLLVEDGTEYEFRNLMAFEQCHYRKGDTYFTDYQLFFNWLIDTPEDVQLLAKAGIIVNFLGSNKQVSNLINSLGNNVTVSRKYYNYTAITQQLICHRNKRWNRYRAKLKQNYFGHPWAATSVIYAVILLLFTVIQVVVGILAIPRVLNVT